MRNRKKIKVSPYRDVKYYKCPYCDYSSVLFRDMVIHL